MRFPKNKFYNVLFIILLIVVFISTMNALFIAAINGEHRPPRSARGITDHSILDTYFEK